MTNSFLQRLQKWLDGSYKLSDEQAMQKMMREDDFVKESFEGYLGVPEEAHVERLARLRAKINSPAEPLTFKRGGSGGRAMWIGAASLALLVGALWFFLKKDAQVADQSLATSTEKSTQQEAPAELSKTDAGGASEDLAAAPLAKHGPVGAAGPAEVQRDMTGNAQINTEVADIVTNTKQDDIQQPSSVGIALEEDDVAMTESVVAKKEEENKPMALDKVKVPNVAAAPKPESTKDIADEDVAWKEVSAARKANIDKKKASSKSKPSAPSAADGGVFHETDRKVNKPEADAEKVPLHPEPMGGMEAYQDYLRTAMRKPDAAMQANVRGKVGLRFSVNKDGRPIQIVTTKSLGYGCNEEAIRLVQEGTFWLQGQDNIVELEIEF